MKFQPRPPTVKPKRNIKIELDSDEYDDVKRRADAAGISMKEYVRQALRFAIEYEDAE